MRAIGYWALVRSDEFEDPDGIESVSRANQAAAFDRISRSIRNRRFSRRRRTSSSLSEVLRPSCRLPWSRSAFHPALHRIHGYAEFPRHLERAAITQLHQLYYLFPKLLRIRLHIGSFAHRLGPPCPRPLGQATPAYPSYRRMAHAAAAGTAAVRRGGPGGSATATPVGGGSGAAIPLSATQGADPAHGHG